MHNNLKYLDLNLNDNFIELPEVWNNLVEGL